MTSDRIREIQETTGLPNSVSVYQALLQVWNECEQSENERLKAALERISNPIKFMQDNLKEGEKLDGFYAIQLSQSASYLKDIAKEALEPQPHKQ